VLGTSNYIAPEQATGQRVDLRTDVYSLGVVLFELLTGDVPFAGESFVAVAMQHVHEAAPSVLDRRRDIPVRVAAAVDRALEKDPADRFASMDELAAELEACLRELDGADTEDTLVGPTPAIARPRGPRRRPPRRSRLPFVLVALGAVLLAGAVAGVLLARDETGPPGSADASGGPTVRLDGVGSFDPPPGDGREHPERVGDATDGDPATYWPTESYRTFAKPGVGLVLEAEGDGAVSRLTVTTDTPGFTAVVRSGSSPETTRVVSPPNQVAGTTTFAVSSEPARYYVVWITNLGPNSSVHVNEVRAG